MRQITQAKALPGHKVALDYASGESIQVDFSPLIDQGGVFSVLADEELFEQVAVGQHGRYIEWPGGLDFCADALFERAASTV